MPMEGRGLSSRQTQQAVRDREIGQPNNSEKCSETADGVACESEGRTVIASTPCTTRSAVGIFWRMPMPSAAPTRACPCGGRGRTGRGRPGLCGHRSVWGGAVAGRTGACTQAGDIPTGADQTRVHTEGQQPELREAILKFEMFAMAEPKKAKSRKSQFSDNRD